MWRSILIIACWAGLVATAPSSEDAFTACLIRRTATPPVIDGAFDDDCWKQGEWQAPLHELGLSRAASEPTTFQVVYDDRNLYLAIECRESAVGTIVKERTAHDAELWDDDCVELFVAPPQEGNGYLHFIANAVGAQFEEKGMAKSWDGAWQVKAQIGADAWRLEVAIPFASLGHAPPAQGVWGFNVCRERHAGGTTQLSSWSHVDAAFHEPEHFGRLVFGDWRPVLSGFAERIEARRHERLAAVQARDPASPCLAPAAQAEAERQLAGLHARMAPATLNSAEFNAIVAGFAALSGREWSARDLVDSKDPAAWQGTVKIHAGAAHSGTACFELTGAYTTGFESALIPVDLAKTYRLSCCMRSLDGANPASGFFGLKMYDQDKRQICMNHVQVIAQSETILSQAVEKGSRELLVDGNPQWQAVSNGRVAFNIKDNLADLPNFACSPPIERVVAEAGRYRVFLREPLADGYPAGTRVRLHTPWGAPLYWVAGGWMPEEWKTFSATLHGEAPCDAPISSFWRGTRFVKVFAWFGNYDKTPKPGAILLVDDIRFIEEE